MCLPGRDCISFTNTYDLDDGKPQINPMKLPRKREINRPTDSMEKTISSSLRKNEKKIAKKDSREG